MIITGIYVLMILAAVASAYAAEFIPDIVFSIAQLYDKRGKSDQAKKYLKAYSWLEGKQVQICLICLCLAYLPFAFYIYELMEAAK